MSKKPTEEEMRRAEIAAEIDDMVTNVMDRANHIYLLGEDESKKVPMDYYHVVSVIIAYAEVVSCLGHTLNDQIGKLKKRSETVDKRLLAGETQIELLHSRVSRLKKKVSDLTNTLKDVK